MSNKNGRFDYNIGKNKTSNNRLINSRSGGTISYRSRVDGKTRVFKVPKFKTLSEEGSTTSITGRGLPRSSAGALGIGGTSMTPGQVQAKNADGTYSVILFDTNLTTFDRTVNVTQLQIDPDETIPAGTWVVVAEHKSGFIMQVPVWLEEEEPE